MGKPKIGFKGYTDVWEQRKVLDEVDSIDTGKSKFDAKEIGEYEILGSTGVIGYDDAYDYEGDFLLTARVGANAGTLYRHSGKVKITDNTVFLQGSNIDFVFYLLDKFDLKKMSFGSGQPLIKASELKNLVLQMPTSNEEKIRIANYFLQLDNLITLHQRKCEQTKKMKKFMLQKMFPQNEQKVPEIRFKGFTNAWEQRKLDDVLEVLKDGTHGTHADVDNGVYLLSAKNIKNGCVSIDESDRQISFEEYEKIHTKFKLKNGDVLMTIVGTIGEAAILESAENITFQRSVAFLRPSNELLNSFLLQTIYTKSFQKELDNRKATGAQPGIYLGEVAQIPIMIPTNLSEQEKISSYFDNLDHLITLHQRKCEKLQNIKKYMLQNMFP